MRRAGWIALVLILVAIPLAHRALAQRSRGASRRPDAPRAAPPDAQSRPRVADATAVPVVATVSVPCVSDVDCRGLGRPGARCFTPALAAQYTQAFNDCAGGSGWRAQHTPGTCVFDECRPDDTPGGDTCGLALRCSTLDMIPFPQRVCVPSTCRNDFECRRHPLGRCASFLNAGRCMPGGWACSYPSDPCIPRDPHRMCPVVPGMLNYCAPRNGRFSCVQEPAIVQPCASPAPVPQG